MILTKALLFYFIFIFIYRVCCHIERSEKIRRALFILRVEDTIITEKAFATITNVKLMDCAHCCLKHSNCTSFNFKYSLPYQCDLIPDVKNNRKTYISKKDWNYYDAENSKIYCNSENGIMDGSQISAIRDITKEFCLVPDNYDVPDGTQLIMKKDKTLCEQPFAKFLFKPETGDIIHHCSNKRVCPVSNAADSPVIFSSQCRLPTISNRWTRTQSK